MLAAQLQFHETCVRVIRLARQIDAVALVEAGLQEVLDRLPALGLDEATALERKLLHHLRDERRLRRPPRNSSNPAHKSAQQVGAFVLPEQGRSVVWRVQPPPPPFNAVVKILLDEWGAEELRRILVSSQINDLNFWLQNAKQHQVHRFLETYIDSEDLAGRVMVLYENEFAMLHKK